MTKRLHVLLIGCLLAAGCSPAPKAGEGSREIHVAAAANLRDVLGEISKAFQAKSGVRVVPTFGPTSQLTQQIANGAPIDVFLSADTDHIDQLVSQGLAEPNSRAIYARGQLALWAPSRPDINTLQDLADARVAQVGCARPELAPYGAAAVQALKKEGLWEAVGPKLVYAQSISASKQFADSGNVAASFTALSLVNKSKGHYIVIPDDEHEPIDQALCVVNKTAQPDAANQFRDFVLSDDSRTIFAGYGYALP